MMSEVEDYLTKLKVICTETDNSRRDAVSAELIESLGSDSFVQIIISIFESNNNVYDEGKCTSLQARN
jgi:hypothetical protein